MEYNNLRMLLHKLDNVADSFRQAHSTGSVSVLTESDTVTITPLKNWN
jgi:hypothetical protein